MAPAVSRCPLAELGHRVQVIDPSPDALASLDRRARERGVADRVTGQQGDLSDLASLVDEADLVLCHGVLEMVDDPAASLAAIAGVLRPGGHLSLLVAQRHAAVVARAMAGHFQAARELLDGDTDDGPGRAAASPTTRWSTSSPPPGCSRRRSTPCGSSPTSCPAASSTSSPVPPRPSSSSSAPSRPGPSTSRSRPSCTSSPAADPSRGARSGAGR